MAKHRKIKLGDIIKPRKEKASPADFPDLPFIGMEHVEAHTMRLLGTVPASTMRSSANRFYAGDVLYGRLRPYLNKVYKTQFDGLCSAEFIVFPKMEEIHPDFLRYRLNAHDFVSFATHLNTGDRPRVDFDGISSFEFFLPSSLEEQQSIVAAIDTQFSRLDEAVTALKRIQANLKRYKAAVLKAAVKGKLTEQWRKDHPDVEPADQLLKHILAERRGKWEAEELAKMKAKGIKPKDDSWKKKYKEPAGPDIANLSELPEGWLWASAEQLAGHIVDGTHHTPTYVESGINFISAKDVIDWKVDFSSCRKIPENEHVELKKRCNPQEGDVLITKSGTIGRVAVVPHVSSFSLFESVAVIPLIKLVSPEFIGYAVYCQVQGEFGAKSQKGVAVKHLHLEDLRRLPIMLPAAAEQVIIAEEIDRRLSVTEELETTIETSLKRAECLRQTILQGIFQSGGLEKYV